MLKDPKVLVTELVALAKSPKDAHKLLGEWLDMWATRVPVSYSREVITTFLEVEFA